MAQEIALRNQQSIALTPSEVVSFASEQAKLLMDIVNQTGCFQIIRGKKYLQVEAWETIGAFNRVHAVTESITPIMDEGIKVGYDAKVTLVNHDGILVGAAIMPCYFTENACKGKEGDDKDKACKSAAQTFATSKAYRMNYSYVAILAGYQPVPAEEMTGEASDERPANLEHWCEEHQTKFFKRGKMPGYAHQLPSGEWHNETSPQTDAPQSKPSLKTAQDALGQAREASREQINAVAPTIIPPKEEGKKEGEDTQKTGGSAVGVETNEPKGKAEKPARDLSTIVTITDMYKACHTDFGLQPKDVMKELNITTWSQLAITPAEAYQNIASVRS